MEQLGVVEDVAGRLTLARLTTPQEVTALLVLFAGIAQEEGWLPGDALSAVPDRAVHFALLDGDDLIGGLQIVVPAADGLLPCHSVWPDVALPAATAHVAIIGVQAAHRGRIELFWMLCQAMWCFCADHRITAVVLEATPKMVTLYRRIGLPLQVVGELRMHWGEPCHLTSVDIVAVAGSVVMRARHSDLFRLIDIGTLSTISALAAIACGRGGVREERLMEQVSERLARISISRPFYVWAIEILNEEVEREEVNNKAGQDQHERAMQEVEKQLAALLDMRIRDLITDAEYIQKKDALISRRASAQLNLAKAGESAENVRRALLSAAEFVFRAREQFVTGDAATKRATARALGSNHILTGGMLALKANSLLYRIEKEYPALKARYEAIELDKTLSVSTKKQRLDAVRLTWYG